MNALVAAPVAECKLYSLDDWAAATAAHHRAMAISREEQHIAPLIERHGIHVLVYDPPPDDDGGVFWHPFTPKEFNEAHRTILEYAKSAGFPYVLSLDSDVIPRSDVVAALEPYWSDDLDFLVQAVPWRASYNRPDSKSYETSCTLAATDTWLRVLGELPRKDVPLYWAVRQPQYKSKKIDVIELDHQEQESSLSPGLVPGTL